MSSPAGTVPARAGWLGTLAMLAASLLVSILLAEGALRLFDYHYTPLAIRRPGALDRRHYHLFEDKSFGYDPELIWAPRKSHDIFNAQGYRGTALPAARRPGELRILAVGDSNTLGWPGPEGANWPADLEQLARARGFDAHVRTRESGGTRRTRASLGCAAAWTSSPMWC